MLMPGQINNLNIHLNDDESENARIVAEASGPSIEVQRLYFTFAILFAVIQKNNYVVISLLAVPCRCNSNDLGCNSWWWHCIG